MIEFNLDSLSWMINISNAQYWQSFVSASTQSTIIDFCYLGDIDFDGTITVSDVLLSLNYILSSNYNTYADMNYNQSNNIQDILILIQIILNA